MMEEISNHGNGNYSSITSKGDADRVLANQISSTLVTVAKDAKIQVEFNPTTVSEYRLVGYDNRRLSNEDFADDNKDAGDVGAGHSVTAFYEISLRSEALTEEQTRQLSEKLNPDLGSVYRSNDGLTELAATEQIAQVKIRYKPTASTTSIEEKMTLEKTQMTSTQEASANFKLATAVISFSEKLLDPAEALPYDFQAVSSLLDSFEHPSKYKEELVQMIAKAKQLSSIEKE